jgi:predicted metal-binding membrane protein
MTALVRSHAGVLLVGAAAIAWAVTVERMRGMEMMDTELGGLGWYLGIWMTMMAAMMLPTAVPAARLAHVARAAPVVVFGVAYLAVWTLFGVAAYVVFRNELDSTVAGLLVVAAGIYELTPLKERSLRRCRAPVHAAGPFRSGLAHGLDCVGCSAGLMVALFAVGVLSLLWMAVVAVVIFAEKVLPQGPSLSLAVAAGLVVLGIGMAVS